MPVSLTTKVPEQSAIVMTAAFTDAAGDAVTPSSITWTLSQVDGTIVNGRENVAIAAPAASNDVTLSGDDTAVIAEFEHRRVWTVKAVYTSTEGADLPLNDEAEFWIDPLVKIP